MFSLEKVGGITDIIEVGRFLPEMKMYKSSLHNDSPKRKNISAAMIKFSSFLS